MVAEAGFEPATSEPYDALLWRFGLSLVGMVTSAAGDGWHLGALVLVTASGLSVADRAGLRRYEDRPAVSSPRITRG